MGDRPKGLRGLLPLSVRCYLQDHSPRRARRWTEVPGIERVRTGGRAVLTFDDGPDPAPGETEAVLDALDRAGAKATFFLLGEQVGAAPGLARRILEEGHDVGVHGQRHFRHDQASASDSVADIEAGFETLRDVCGIVPRFYRPPYGKLPAAGAAAARRLGMEIVYWSTWGLDWEPISSDRVARRVARELDDGAIVLLHDSARFANRPSAIETARAVQPIAELAANRGLDLLTLSDACGEPSTGVGLAA